MAILFDLFLGFALKTDFYFVADTLLAINPIMVGQFKSMVISEHKLKKMSLI